MFFGLPSMNGPLPAQLKFRENTALLGEVKTSIDDNTTGQRCLFLESHFFNPTRIILDSNFKISTGVCSHIIC